MLDIAHLRADTPGTAHRVHLNNAGASLPPRPVLDAIENHLRLEAEMGGYEAADAQAAAIEGFYAATARLLNAEPRNIAFAASATDAYARALSAIPLALGDVVLTTENDYVSNQIAFLALQKHRGIRLVRAKDRPEGGVDLADLEVLLQAHPPKVVAVTHVPTNSGLVQPVDAVGALVRRHAPEAWYIVDACQSAGQMPLDVQTMQCDFLSATLRKFLRGPRGAGFLFASDRVLRAGLEMPLPDMRSADWTGPNAYTTAPTARRFEYWEMPTALVLGSRAAIEYALDLGLADIAERVHALAALTRALLAELPGVQVLDRGTALCGIVTAHSPAWESQPLMQQLAAAGINCRLSSRAVAQIDFPRKGVEWALRISPHYYNTEEEVRRCVEVLGR